jgi:hypothetical protein
MRAVHVLEDVYTSPLHILQQRDMLIEVQYKEVESLFLCFEAYETSVG